MAMILGMPEQLYTALHVIVSLIGIASGFVVAYGLLKGRILRGWTGVFLATTILTSLSGFGFPVEKLLPSHVIGILSLVTLGIAVLSLYTFQLRGGWRSAYVITALLALYFNSFVAIVQSFLKSPTLHALAPTQKEPPFAAAQLALLLVFITITIVSLRRRVAVPGVSLS
jgi:hypothetical protein